MLGNPNNSLGAKKNTNPFSVNAGKPAKNAAQSADSGPISSAEAKRAAQRLKAKNSRNTRSRSR